MLLIGKTFHTYSKSNSRAVYETSFRLISRLSLPEDCSTDSSQYRSTGILRFQHRDPINVLTFLLKYVS